MKRFGWLAALLLVVVVNAVVLAGVAWNRSGEPDATLQLTERELPLLYRFSRSQENTGVAFRLNLSDGSNSPDWLDADKLRQLGFYVPQSGAGRDARDARSKRPLPRQAWVVLEFDGPAWQALLAEQTQRLADARLAVEKGEVTREQVKSLEKALARMRQSGSRLVAVDAGTEPSTLRARYPDRSRYLITGAKVRAWVEPSLSAEDASDSLAVKSYLQLLVNRIHVPLQQQKVLQSVLGGELRNERSGDAQRPPRYVVHLRYGRRYEPWVVDIASQ